MVKLDKVSTAKVSHMPHYMPEFKRAWGAAHMQNGQTAWGPNTAADRLTEVAVSMAIELACPAYTPTLR